MSGDEKSCNPSQGQKSWPAGYDLSMDEDLELLSCFRGEPEIDRASKVLKQNRLTKALEEPEKGSQSKCGRDFQITLNEVEHWTDVKLYLFGLSCFQYAIACREFAPTTGHPHIHCYVQLNQPRRLSLKKLKGAHIEKCYASPQKNIDYIYKRGDFVNKKHSPNDIADIIWEEGELKEKGGCKTIKELKTIPREELDEQNIYLYNICEKEKIRRDSIVPVKEMRKRVNVFYIHGESGKGKTVFAHWIMEKLNIEFIENIKREDNFYHGVKGECKTALYDDFRDSHMRPSEFINLIDYNLHTMNIKNGSVVNHYENIFITSVQSPREIWNKMEQRDEAAEQWLRRITYCVYVNNDHLAVLQEARTGKTIKEYHSFQKYMEELLKEKEKEEKANELMNLLE